MEYKILGSTGVKISSFCLGTDNFADPTPEKESINILDAAIDAGINLFDTGDVYADGEGERIIGRALKNNGKRHDILIATKVDHGEPQPGLPHGFAQSHLTKKSNYISPNLYGHTRLSIIKACEKSLKRLKTDYIDLYQLHRPSSIVPIEETLDVLTDLIKQGKIRYIGCSTHPAWKVAESIRISEKCHFSKISTEQSPYNLLDRRIENELIPMCEYYGLGLITWAPLAMGVLAGRYKKNKQSPKNSRAILRGGFYADRVNERGIDAGLKFNKIAINLGLTSAQLAVLWVKHQKGVTAPLIGPRTIKQLKEFIKIIDMSIDESVCDLCDQIVPPGSAVADFHNTAPWMKMRI